MLELIDITKVYKGRKRAVDGLTLRLGTGLVGLLGPNGAGKSSLLRIAATVTRPTGGQVRFEGGDAVARPGPLRRALGYLPQDFGVYPHLTGHEFLTYLAAVRGLAGRSTRARVGELLELVNLTHAAKWPLGGYSGGMLRRIGIAQALLADPRIIVVDEPTAGLDPQERVRFRNLLSDLSADRSVLLSTHIVSDVESVATRIVVVTGGRIRFDGEPGDLLGAVAGHVWELAVPPAELTGVQQRLPVTRLIRAAGHVTVRVLATHRPAPGATPVPPDLEDAYLAVVHGAGDAR
jgi:ABC-2 type transport system ATP-binding protein